MKPDSQNPERVGRLLREWQVRSALPPRFVENVWRRIESAEHSGTRVSNPSLWALIRAWITTALPRPAFAVAYISLLLIAELLAGYWHSQAETANWDKVLASRYVQTIDPFGK